MTSHIQVAQHLLKNHNEHVLKQGHGYRVLSPRAGVRMLGAVREQWFFCTFTFGVCVLMYCFRVY